MGSTQEVRLFAGLRVVVDEQLPVIDNGRWQPESIPLLSVRQRRCAHRRSVPPED